LAKVREKLTRREFIKHGIRGLVAAAVLKGHFNTWSGQVDLVRQPVRIQRLPPSFHGLKIGHLTDLHSSLIVSRGQIATAAQLVMAEEPDLIVLTGDFISGATKFLSGSVGEFKENTLFAASMASPAWQLRSASTACWETMIFGAAQRRSGKFAMLSPCAWAWSGSGTAASN
jgi:hypothetical protein